MRRARATAGGALVTIVLASVAVAGPPPRLAIHRFGPPPGATDATSAVIDEERRGLLDGFPQAPPRPPALRHRTEPVRVPEDAVLEVAFGFLPPGAGGPSRFEISACDPEGGSDACRTLFSEVHGEDAKGWLLRSVPVGRPGRFAFRFDVVPARAGSSSAEGDPTDLPVWAVPTLVAPRAEPATRRNLLLISLDTLRADHLGSYGYARDTSPFIDRELAARGTLFERCISAATTTGPSHMTIFTGLPPAVHGVHGDSYYRALPDGVPTLAEVLRENGFATAAVTEDGPMGAYRGFDRGFDSYVENESHELAQAEGHVEETLARGLAWLRHHRRERRFLFLHTFQVHSPYSPPPELGRLFEGDGVDPRRTQLLPRAWKPVRYDREIRYTDGRLATFFGTLDAEHLLADTIVVLLSDHGEEFLEHGALVHGPAVHEEVLQVPCIVRGPGVAAGRRIEQPVSLVDWMPTLLELAGVPQQAPETARSLARFVRDTAPGAQPPRPPDAQAIFSEARAGRALVLAGREERKSGHKLAWRRVEIPIFALRVGSEKLIRYPNGAGEPRYERFDLARDPGERIDRWNPDDPRGQELRRILEEHIARTTRRRAGVAAGGGCSRRTPEPRPGPPREAARPRVRRLTSRADRLWPGAVHRARSGVLRLASHRARSLRRTLVSEAPSVRTPPSPDAAFRVREHVREIAERGFTLLERVIEPELVEALRRGPCAHRAGARRSARATNDFEGTRNGPHLQPAGSRRRSSPGCPVHPAVLPVVEGVLDAGCLVSSLSSIDIGPGETAQPIHTDDMVIALPPPASAAGVQHHVGADRLHARRTAPPGWCRAAIGGRPPPTCARTIRASPAEMPAGSVLVWNGSLWHGGGANRTPQRRVGIAMNYCAGFVRQQENQQLGIPRDKVRNFPERLQRLVGYGVYRSLIGHIDKQDPRMLLGGPASLRAIWDE